jgi:predicted LPLAT superfamily acyltransferase
VTEKKWDGTTYGTSWMHRWLIGLLRYIDVRLLYVFAYVFVVPPCLFRPGRAFIYRYYRQQWGYGTFRALMNTYIQHCMFAQVVIDKFAMYAGKHFDIEVDGFNTFQQLAELPDAYIQLSAHIGNYEIAGYTLTAKDKRLNALVFAGEKDSVMRNRGKMFAETNIRMIPIREDMSHMFVLNEVLESGETLSMPADRMFGSKKAITLPFLNGEADFPLGPFSVTTMRSLNAIAVNVMKVSAQKYKIYVTALPYDKTAARRQQTEQLAKAYVRELERMVRLYPHQWYNFFDFWK